ncbi:ATP-binding protein [Flavobacterium rhizosphaerae]|uniref:histidine kinase n=1 Tax=Flavobacterium rhizosphaerae TaxID=3163298 RepID=A0ABW8YY58_9FLAO
MDKLLDRQIAKFLKEGQTNGMEEFLASVKSSYANYEDQIALLQRAMKLSSDELFAANEKLREESESLKEINKNLQKIIDSINPELSSVSATGFNPAEYIKQQAEEIVKMNQQRQKLLSNLETQNQELNDYAHMVSHDLKSPLRTINTLVSWVISDNREKLDAESINSLNLILLNIEKMEMLISGILKYSSIDKLESENRMVDFNNIVEDVLQSIITPTNIEVKINNRLPKIYGNHFRFRQLFQNLIENAVKYNDKEKGIIEIGSTDRESEVLFYIKDNGKGIPKAYFDKIFNIFTKLDSQNHSSGVGLSIVKKIISFYGGKIWLESTENQQTTFFFTLPHTWNYQTWTI